jgi:hypothetical protein
MDSTFGLDVASNRWKYFSPLMPKADSVLVMEGLVPIQNQNAHPMVIVCFPLGHLAWSLDQSVRLGQALHL